MSYHPTTNEPLRTDSQVYGSPRADIHLSAVISSEPSQSASRLDLVALQMGRSSARTMSRQLKRRHAKIRRSAVRRSRADDARPPLIDLFSQKGGVGEHLKLALICNWMAGSAGGGFGQTAHIKPDVNTPVSGPYTAPLDWVLVCEMLALPCASVRDRSSSFRRLRNYSERVERAGLIELSDDRTRFRLLREDGSRSPYSDPGEKATRDSATDKFFKLPPQLFENGWITLLPGAALMTLLILTEMDQYPEQFSGDGRRDRGIWANDALLEQYYPISPSSFQRGVSALSALGLVRPETEVLHRYPRRSRSRYHLRLDRLDEDAADEHKLAIVAPR